MLLLLQTQLTATVAVFDKWMEQTVTYWAPATNNGFGGKNVALPRQIKARWQDTQSLQRSADGSVVVCNATVYVAEVVEIGGYLYLGETTGTPVEVGAQEIKNVGRSPSLSAKEELVKVWL